MVRLVYTSPSCEVFGVVQLGLLCQNSFNGDRSFDPLQDAYGDWDPND